MHHRYLVCYVHVGTAFDEVAHGQHVALLRCVVQR